jgi:hypothetical protein
MTRIACSLLVAVASFASTLVAAEPFPAVDQLPSRPELPDPLVMLDGSRVKSPDDWFQKRRPELKSLFQHYMYGYLPPKPARFDVTDSTVTDDLFSNGKATASEVALVFHGPDLKHKLRVLLIVPNKRSGPVPVFVGMNFCGNHAVVDHSLVHIPESWVYKSCAGVETDRATEKGRGGQTDVWNVDMILDRGYALATFYSGDIDPDTADFSDGIEPSFYKPGQTGPEPHDAGTIAAWAWGYHRVVDYLVEQKKDVIDPKRIAAVGHSRNGKTTLLAAAMDDRIALAIPHQAGCGGTAPSRGKVGESVQRINTSFPHWFCDNFPKFNEQTDRLPFDQHCLVALCAPRPVLFTNAMEDQWANPDGQFDMLKAADPVYRFLNAGGLEAKERPELNTLVNSRLGYYIRPGKHSMNRDDWKVFLDFADKQLGKK